MSGQPCFCLAVALSVLLVDLQCFPAGASMKEQLMGYTPAVPLWFALVI